MVDMKLLAFQAIGLACCYFFFKLIMAVPLFRKQMRRVLRLSASRVTRVPHFPRAPPRRRRLTPRNPPSAARRRVPSTSSPSTSRASSCGWSCETTRT
jgi:hypothetical protein